MSELPLSWIECQLGEILKIRHGYAFKSTDFTNEGVPLVRQANLTGDTVDLSNCVHLPNHYLEEYQRFGLQAGDILIGMSGSIGKLCIYDKPYPALQNQRLGKIDWISGQYTYDRYIWHFLKTIEGTLVEKGKGIAIANVSAGDIESISVPLAPLGEQKRIADKLDAILARDVQHVAPPPGAEGQRTRIKVGDILISITADIGMVALVREDLGESYINQHLCLARQTGEYSGPYLAYFLASPIGGLAQLTKGQRGATKAGLTLEDIREVQIQAPLRDEQDEIVRRVEALFAYADRLEARYTAARARIERLTPVLLAKAFRGELVPQDPNDEPASILLERIQAARASSEGAAGPKRRKGGGRPKISKKAEVLMLTCKDVHDTHLTTILKEGGPLTAEALWSASQLDIDDFYDQLKDEEARGLLREKRGGASNAPRMLEAA